MSIYSRDDEAHYDNVARSAARLREQGSAAARYDASRSPERRAAEERLKASKRAKDAAFEASMSKPVSVAAPKPAKPAASNSTPKAPTPKRDPEAEYLRGVANGRAAERTRIGRVYDMAKTCGGDGQALKLLATTDLDSKAINERLYGVGSANASAALDDVWDRAIAKVSAQNATGGAA